MRGTLPKSRTEDGDAVFRQIIANNARWGVLLERTTQRFVNGARRGNDEVTVVVTDRGVATGLAPDFRTDGFTDHVHQRFGAFSLGADTFLLNLPAAISYQTASAST